jgi:hypothetical protein
MRRQFTTILATGILSTMVAFAADQAAPGDAPEAGAAPATPVVTPAAGAVRAGNTRATTAATAATTQRAARTNRNANVTVNNLSNDQLLLLQQATQKDADKIRALQDKLQAARIEFLDTSLAIDYEEKAIREKAEAVANLELEIALLRCSAIHSVTVDLTPEEKQQLQQSQITLSVLTTGNLASGGTAGLVNALRTGNAINVVSNVLDRINVNGALGDTTTLLNNLNNRRTTRNTNATANTVRGGGANANRNRNAGGAITIDPDTGIEVVPPARNQQPRER